MSIIWAIFGISSLACLGVAAWWLINQGKKSREADYAKAEVVLIEDHAESIKRWAKENDRLSKENRDLKARLADMSLRNVVRVLSDAHEGTEVPSSK